MNQNFQQLIKQYLPIIIIPCRMQATRLPGKPLASINGVPMVQKIQQQALQLQLGRVVVATPDKEIIETVQTYGGECIQTELNCPSGTDRVASAVKKLDPQQTHKIVINLQGDLACFDNNLVQQTFLALALNYQHYDILTPCVTIGKATEQNNPNVVKPVISFASHHLTTSELATSSTVESFNQLHSSNLKVGKALYFTRTACPYGDGTLYQHLGIYAYRRPALQKLVSFAPSELEKRENLEQLRALENNMKVGVVVVESKLPTYEVNTPEDLQTINNMLKNG